MRRTRRAPADASCSDVLLARYYYDIVLSVATTSEVLCIVRYGTSRVKLRLGAGFGCRLFGNLTAEGLRW